MNRAKIEDMNRELQTLNKSEAAATATSSRSGDAGVSEVIGGNDNPLSDTSLPSINKLTSVKVKLMDFCKRTKKEYLLALVVFLVVIVALVVSKPAFVHRPGKHGFCFGVAFLLAATAALAVVIVPIVARSLKK
jgi:hypothetical protein